MNAQVNQILVVEDDEGHAALTRALITDIVGEGVVVDLAKSGREALARIVEAPYDLCLLDYRLGDEDGLGLLRALKLRDIELPIIVLTGMGGEDVAVDAMKTGAVDYIRKGDLTVDTLAASMRYALELYRKEQARREAEEALQRAKDELEIRVQERTAELISTNEELQAANRALLEADRLKHAMLQNISHEFRTPLTYLVGYFDMIRQEMQKPLPLDLKAQEEMKEYVEISFRQMQKLARLVDNFYTVQSSTEQSYTRESTDLTGVIAEAVEGARLAAAEKKIELVVHSVEVAPLVLIDRLAILQVMDNLLSNAVKFTPEEGTITVEVRVPSEPNKVLVAVGDTGIGIPLGPASKVFERFFQVDGSSTRRYGGVGLGLAVCKTIIEGHGESIWVTSAPGAGATFVFSLPVAPKKKNGG